MGAFPIVATIYSSGLNLCSLPFVKQDSAGAFVELERYLTLPLSSGGMWQPACWKVVQQWSTSKADMVNYFCKALNTEGGAKMRVLAFVKTAPVLVLLLREIVQQKKRAENHCISHNQCGLGGKKKQFFLQSRFTSITLQFFFLYSRAIYFQQRNDHNISAGS